DQALLANAQVDLQRYKKLWAQDSIPKQQLDTQEALVRQDVAAIESDRGQVDAAKLQLTYSRIIAPISGRLGLRLVDAGNMVHANDTGGLVTITQIQPISVVFSVPEDDLPSLRARLQGGDPPEVQAFDREGTRRLATGSVLTVDNAIDPTTGTVKVKAQFPNDDDALFPNQFVNARLLLDVRRGATLVPGVAVRRGTQGPFVYVVTPGKTAQARPVHVGVSEGGDTSIEDGLSPGDVVVVDGADSLRDGMPGTPDTLGRGRPRARRRRRRGRGGLAARRHAGHPEAPGPCGGRAGPFVSLSRPFIVRPGATSLLMVAILLAGALGYRQPPVSAL